MSKSAKKVVLTGKVDAQAWVKTNNGYPEVGLFAEEKVLQKFYKQLSDEQVLEWVTVEGLEFKPCPTSQPINRMRMCMSILNKHFPKESTAKTKAKSKYADMTTEQLVQMAIDNEAVFELCDNMAILRMRCIMSLRAKKIID